MNQAERERIKNGIATLSSCCELLISASLNFFCQLINLANYIILIFLLTKDSFDTIFWDDNYVNKLLTAPKQVFPQL